MVLVRPQRRRSPRQTLLQMDQDRGQDANASGKSNALEAIRVLSWQWLDEFPNWAIQGSGLGDLSINQDWERQCELKRGRRVYIWSSDDHLSSFDRGPEI